MSYPTTLKELARILNLAPSTVSRALKGHPDISAATQQRVRNIAMQMHYQPSALAKGLRNRKSYLIALVLPDLNDFFYIQTLKGVIGSAYEKGYKVIIYETQEQTRKEADICFSLLKSGIDGLLIAPAKTSTDSSYLEALKQGGIPVVFLERIIGNIEADRILEDDFHGACLAVNHLIEKGCKHIAHFSASPQCLWAQKRQLGYLQALQDHHFSINRNLIIEHYEVSEMERLIKNLINQFHIDGIFAINDEVAIQAMYTLKKTGYRIPQDIAICGFGNDPVGKVTSPTLTTVKRDGCEIGKIAANFLINRMEKKTKDTQTKLLRNELIIRESS